MKTFYLIQHVDYPYLFWSNQLGWVEDGECIDIFTKEDTETLNLPIEGKWIRSQGDDDA